MKRSGILVLLALAAIFASCRTVPLPPPGASAAPPSPPSSPHRVVLLSLDGAGADVLRQLETGGGFGGDGFARFFAQGSVADRLIPVNPSLTATNHISLASGYDAAHTGIVSNNYRAAGSPFLASVSGFAAPIATETLWEAALRQGKKVGVLTWPAADDTGPRRRGSWGLAYVDNPDREPVLLAPAVADWKPADPSSPATAVESRSPLVSLAGKVGSQDPAIQTFAVTAVDHSDDGRVNYDALALVQTGVERMADPVQVIPGQWFGVPCRLTAEKDAAPYQATCPVKLLELSSDLSKVRLYFGAVYPLHAYPADFAALLDSRKLVWPGPPDDRSVRAGWAGEPGIDLDTWLEQSDRFTRFFGDGLVEAARRSDWDLLMAYVPTIDEAGHLLQLDDKRQAGFTPERSAAFAKARQHVWQAVDRELARLLAVVDLKTTTVLIVSDHGMTPVHTQVDPNVLLRDQGLLATDAKGKIVEAGTSVYAVASGAVIHLYAASGKESVLPQVATLFRDWRIEGEAPAERVLTRKEAGALGLDSPNSGDLVVFLREGYMTGNRLRDGKVSGPPPIHGTHGFLTEHPDMHGIYLALGAGIAHGNAGTVQNPEVAGRVASWLGIEKPRPEAPKPPQP